MTVDLPEDESRALVQQLRQKDGNWVAWGRACQRLQSAGYQPQQIFEETGFEPIHQNQLVVAAQVYETIAAAGMGAAVRSRFEDSGSDILYELRVLPQAQRGAAADLVAAQQLDASETREVARAIQEYDRLPEPPAGFGREVADAVAYRYWCLARGKKDLQERSRAIARALKFASSDGARQQIEKLLSDFTVVPAQPAPMVPFYRLESEDELPRLLPLLPSLAVSAATLAACPSPQLVADSAFDTLELPAAPAATAWIALPGWASVRAAVAPVAIICSSEAFAGSDGEIETVLAIVDRGNLDWTPRSYFIVERTGTLACEWFAREPATQDGTLLARVILVLRPKRLLESGSIVGDSWDLNE